MGRNAGGVGLEPIEAYPGVDHAWRCRHLPCGKLVAPTYSNVKRGQGGCQSCGLARLSERFRLDPHEAEDRLRRAGLEALEPYPGSSKPWRARHLQCGRVVTPTLANVQAGRGLCRYCYSDFPYASAAQLYLATDGFALKVGICAPGSDRLRQHRRWGWSICWVVDVSSVSRPGTSSRQSSAGGAGRSSSLRRTHQPRCLSWVLLRQYAPTPSLSPTCCAS